MILIDARGKPCPQPVMMAKAAVDQGALEIEVHVDNDISAQNVLRFLGSQGFTSYRSGAATDIVVSGHREGGSTGSQRAPEVPIPVSRSPEGIGVLFLGRTLGQESPELGEALIKAFLGTLAASSPPPATVALMNGGIFLALEESSTSEVLREMESRGCRVLVCGTCVTHFGVADRLAAGTLSNMFEITDAMLRASKTLVLG